jgi:hypothetical protein
VKKSNSSVKKVLFFTLASIKKSIWQRKVIKSDFCCFCQVFSAVIAGQILGSTVVVGSIDSIVLEGGQGYNICLYRPLQKVKISSHLIR